MPKVHLPDGRIVHFPEGMAPEQIQTEVAKLAGPVTPPPPERTWTDTAVDALPTIGGAVGGLVGGLGGTVAGMGVGGIPGAIGGAAVGGAGGEGLRQAIQTWRGQEPPRQPGEALTDIGKQAAVQGAAEGGGILAGGALRLAGRGMYRAGALPILSSVSKYGDQVTTGIANRVPVTQAGLAKAGRLKTTAQAAKQAAVSAADDTAGFRTRGVVDAALEKVEPQAEKLRRAGMGDSTKALTARAERLVAENGPGVTPSELETIKGTLDDTLGPAYKKLRMREALTPPERMNLALKESAGESLAGVVPNYKGLNRDVMDAVGLQKMVGRRLQGNQGLENALTMAVGPAALPARLAMLPGVASTAGIVTHMAGEHPALSSNAIRAALLALMSKSEVPR